MSVPTPRVSPAALSASMASKSPGSGLADASSASQ